MRQCYWTLFVSHTHAHTHLHSASDNAAWRKDKQNRNARGKFWRYSSILVEDDDYYRFSFANIFSVWHLTGAIKIKTTTKRPSHIAAKSECKEIYVSKMWKKCGFILTLTGDVNTEYTNVHFRIWTGASNGMKSTTFLLGGGPSNSA